MNQPPQRGAAGDVAMLRSNNRKIGNGCNYNTLDREPKILPQPAADRISENRRSMQKSIMAVAATAMGNDETYMSHERTRDSTLHQPSPKNRVFTNDWHGT